MIIGDGQIRPVFAVNGSVPGPTILVYEGQEVRVIWIHHTALIIAMTSPHKMCTGVVSCWGRVTHICARKRTIISSYKGLAPSHYMNQCWNTVNSNLRNKLQWNLERNSYIFVHENVFENVVCEMAAIFLMCNKDPQILTWVGKFIHESFKDRAEHVS